MTAAVIPAHLALPLIQNRAERLAADMRTIRGLDPLLLLAIGGIATDLADVIAQLPEATS